ncbi:MAG TPA: aspartyl/asparaginyl beta-hydroxylase domain-containing protein [Candidatus Sulfotelmatobacter sp.]|nr:aspartyl/asparaginyl beta-hydroxylase domain-containing protein [Candidatus Sulfotelmatobacter sp.]
MSLFYDQTSNVVRAIYDRRISAPSVLDADAYFPAAEKFAEAWPAIRDEALTVAGRLGSVPRFHEIMHEQRAISANDNRDWRMLILKAYGISFPQNMATCPTLAAVVEAAPDVISASISFLAPGKHIPPHRGPFRGVLRFYLGLCMPKKRDGSLAAVLKIDDEEYRVDNGEYLLWDDTYPHEVWNDSDQVRIVLLLDVWRRDMPTDMELLSRFLVSLVRVGIRFRGVST